MSHKNDARLIWVTDIWPRGYKTLFNFEFQNIWGGFKKINIFWGMILWIFFGGHHKFGLYLGVFSMHSRVFS